MEKQNVLSLFNGLGCVWLALEEANIPVGKRYSSEIEKFPNKANDTLYPDTEQLGDVRNVDVSKLEPIQFLAGGSPCQSFSFAGKRKGMATKCEIEILSLEHYLELKEQNFEFEGQSYLFWEYIRILTDIRKYNPDVKFLLENVIMGAKWQKVITQAIGINPIRINAALVSAQNRDRLFWTNIYTEQDGLFGDLKCMIPQPKDQGILLKDILETDVADKYFLSEKMSAYINRESAKIPNRTRLTFPEQPKCGSVLANEYKMGTDSNFIVHNTMPRSSKTGKGGTGALSWTDGKTYCLDTGNTNAIEMVGAIKFGRTQEAKALRKENIANGHDSTPFQAKEITGVDYEKMGTLTTSSSKDNLLIVAQRGRGENNEQQLEPRTDGKTNCLTSVQKDNLVIQINPSLESGGKQPYQHNRVYDIEGISPCLNTDTRSPAIMVQKESLVQIGNIYDNEHNSVAGRVYTDGGKSVCLSALRGVGGAKTGLYQINKTIRRLTPRECGRLQSIPEDKLELLLNCGISDSQLYKAFGNGWNIKVISWILQHLNK